MVGAVLLLFYGGLSVYLWKKRDADAPAASGKEVLAFFAKIVLTVLVVVASGYIAVIGGMILMSEGMVQRLLRSIVGMKRPSGSSWHSSMAS